MRSDAGRCPISSQCGILGVAKSTCYWMLDRPETEWVDPHGEDVGARVARRRQVRRGFLPQRRQEWSDSSTS